MTLIDQRPAEVLERLVPGHWEGDLIKGKQNRSQVGTLVERSTLFVALVRLENGNAETAAEGFAQILNRFDAEMRRSMTYDRGREMAPPEPVRTNRPQGLLRPTRTAPGNVASTRTPTASCADTYPKEETSASTRKINSTT